MAGVISSHRKTGLSSKKILITIVNKLNFAQNRFLYLSHMNNKAAVAEKLLQINAIKLSPQQPYTWASGWKSPIYCDNRKTLSFPNIRDFIKSEMCNIIFEFYPAAQVLAGVATAGIAWGAMASDQLKLPFIYVRS